MSTNNIVKVPLRIHCYRHSVLPTRLLLVAFLVLSLFIVQGQSLSLNVPLSSLASISTTNKIISDQTKTKIDKGHSTTRHNHLSLSSPSSSSSSSLELSAGDNDSTSKLHLQPQDDLQNITDETVVLDRLILSTALPAMLNLAIVPVVTSIETMWIGRMGDALALAGQSAACTAYLTVFYLLSFLPTMAAPMVARLIGGRKKNEARQAIGETLSMCVLLGLAGTFLLALRPMSVLRLALSGPESPAAGHALSYLKWRALCMIPMLINATGFAAFRGSLDTRTPMKVTLVASALKVLLDPFLIFYCNMGVIGAPISSLITEIVASILNTHLLVRRKLLDISSWRKLVPRWKSTFVPLLSGGLVMMIRQIAINVCTLVSSQRAQSLGSAVSGAGAGVEAAAYGVTMNIYTIGFVVHVAMQGAAASLIPAEWAKHDGSVVHAQRVADRLFQWSLLTGVSLGVVQYALLPFLVPLFTTLPEVRAAIRAPALIVSLLHVVNGPRFVAEGEMIGLQSFRDLTGITVVGMLVLVGCLKGKLGQSLQGVMMANLVFCSYQTMALFWHYWRVGKLRRSNSGSSGPTVLPTIVGKTA